MDRPPTLRPKPTNALNRPLIYSVARFPRRNWNETDLHRMGPHDRGYRHRDDNEWVQIYWFITTDGPINGTNGSKAIPRGFDLARLDLGITWLHSWLLRLLRMCFRWPRPLTSWARMTRWSVHRFWRCCLSWMGCEERIEQRKRQTSVQENDSFSIAAREAIGSEDDRFSHNYNLAGILFLFPLEPRSGNVADMNLSCLRTDWEGVLHSFSQ